MSSRIVEESVIREWIAEGIADSSGGSSSLVYTALLSQAGTSDPVSDDLQDDFGIEGSWERFNEGNYETGSAIPSTSKIYVNGLCFDDGSNGALFPYYDQNGALKMLLTIYWYDDSGTLVFGITTKDETGTYADLGALLTALGLSVGTAKLALPKIEAYTP